MADASAPLPASPAEPYLVVARRYRPQGFAELVGQQHVARALTNAIAGNRVGHAYLFTGARGVGKTSAARILAKALDCVRGPTAEPCNACDVCLSIAAGSDVDVLEIDGASNRGIDEIRQLRQNVNVRPSRARYKVYIIDEVHMLTREAFNALLKTLEEPPEHVKFIFCTTEVTKIPVTILSRCQRFDFAGIRPGSIAERLAQIVEQEQVAVDPAALALLARRANGSMRDSQSLLEQLLAFGRDRIGVEDVHALLGTAGDARLAALLDLVLSRQIAGALGELDAALAEGVDVGQLLEQLLGYLRDLLVAGVGGTAEQLLCAPAQQCAALAEAGRRLGVETVLAMLQIVEQALGRLRFSTQGRLVAEIAVVRLCALENLQELADLVGRLEAPAERSAGGGPAGGGTTRGMTPAPAVARAVPRPAETRAVLEAPAPAIELSEAALPEVWRQALGRVSNLLAGHAGTAGSLAICAPNRLVATFSQQYNFHKSFCERPEQLAELERALAETVGRPMQVELASGRATDEAEPVRAPRPAPTQRQRLAEKADHPLVRRACELFDAHPVRVDEPET
jgi:DNA polymerase-3 subunit gamma/tau